MGASPATNLGTPRVTSRTPLSAGDCRFIELQELKYLASNGAERRWEAVNRKTRPSGADADAVDIFTHIKHPTKEAHTIIVLQFRPPINGISVEFPAGLIDEGETAEQAALRELREETGYGESHLTKATIQKLSRPLADSPGMSTESTIFVTLEITLPEGNEDFPLPKQKLDEGEFIEIRLVPLRGLYDTLVEYQKLGYVVDTRLHHFAYGMKFGMQISK